MGRESRLSLDGWNILWKTRHCWPCGRPHDEPRTRQSQNRLETVRLPPSFFMPGVSQGPDSCFGKYWRDINWLLSLWLPPYPVSVSGPHGALQGGCELPGLGPSSPISAGCAALLQRTGIAPDTGPLHRLSPLPGAPFLRTPVWFFLVSAKYFSVADSFPGRTRLLSSPCVARQVIYQIRILSTKY